MTIRNLDRLLEPASVAVIGASSRPASVGATVWRNVRAGFRGSVHAVNPKHASLDGVAVHARVADLPEAPDLALICTPPATVPGLIAELGARGTRAAVVMTAGLTPQLRQAMLDAARVHLLRILGPNCIGLLVPHIGLNASFAHTDALPGELALVSQSGALVTAMLDWSRSRRIGFSAMVSLGERADADFGDLLDYLASDGRTRAILLYIESIDAPRKFMSAARAAARNKPVIVVKAGRAGHGVAAASSHTGALAGADIVFDAAIRRAGMLRVDTLQELFLAAETLTRFRSAGDAPLTIVTNGGGAGVMAADAAELGGVPLADLEPALMQRLDALLPANWSRANPIDLIGDAPVGRYTGALQALIETDPARRLLFIHSPTAIVPSADIARACVPLLRAARGRVMGCWLGDEAVQQARRVFVEAGIADYATPEEAVRAYAMLATYRRNQRTLLEAPTAAENPAPDLAAARVPIERALAEGRRMLTEPEAKAVLAACGLPVAATRLAAPDADAAVEAARAVGYPVALKIVAQAITHKSDVGGVRLDLGDDAAVRQAAGEMLASVRRLRPDAPVEGLSVQAMVKRAHAQEVIVGAHVDPMFGPVVLFGAGGTAVEVLADRAIALPPLNRALARELVSRTRIARLLEGWRDHPPAQLNALYDALIAVAQMLADLPQIVELDINPLLVNEDGVIALDARLGVAAAPPDAGSRRFAIRPYPAQLAERLDWQGRPLLIRPIRPEDEAQHLAFLARLDPEDIRLRVFYTRRDIPREELARLTQIDYAREMAFVAVAPRPDGDGEETLAAVRAIADPDNREAEFGIVVRSDLKAGGLGRVLLEKMIRYARSQGTGRLTAVVLRENAGMLALGKALGFAIDRERPLDPGTVNLTLTL